MTLVWDIPFPTQSQKLIALKLADYASDDGGSVFPARETLAKLSGCSEETAKRALRCFRAIGLLQLIRQGGNGPKDTNEWQLNVDLLRRLADGTVTLSGGVSELQLEGETGAGEAVEDLGRDCENKGVKMTPLPALRGSNEGLRGSSLPDKGVTGDPQTVKNHHLDSSLARAGACEADASPSRAEVQPTRAQPALTVRRGDASWNRWLITLSAAVAEQAEASGAIEVTARWPETPGARCLRAVPPANQTANHRTAGDGA